VTYREGDEQRFLDALHETLERRAQALLYLLKNHSTDLVMAVFMESDHVIHSFWKYHDATHPSHRPEYASYEHAIRDVYKHLDDVLGRVMSLLGSDGTLLVVSDHGCGPYHGHVHINKLLMQHQLLAIRKRPATRIKAWLARYRVAERLYGLSTYLGIDLRPLVPKRVRQAAVQSGIGARDIDWDRTSAYVSGDFGQVSVNLMGRERQGSVDPRDKEAVIDEVIRLLDTLRHPEDGKPLVDNVWRASALYAGKCLESAPDVIFCMRGYSYQNSMGLGLHVEGLVEKPRFAQGEVSGGHAPDGILYATGPGIRQGVQLEGMNLTQLAPTVLYRLGIAVPATMDGRVIESLFKPEHLASHPLRYRHGDAPEEEPAESDAIYSSEQLNQVESRLRDLGYLG
jgi:predicted AlkP superfamily phosphohydrolase/phosphomutase